MEQRLFQAATAIHCRVGSLSSSAELLHRQELIHRLKPDSDRLADLSDRVQQVRQAVLAQMEVQYPGPTVRSEAQTMDRTWRLISFLRNLLRQGGNTASRAGPSSHDDLEVLKRVVHMGSWQPHYVDLDPSQERLAEMVLKLEREVYGSRRPRQLAKRDVFVRIGDPIDLASFVARYVQDPQPVRRRVAERLRDVIQNLIDSNLNPPANAE